MKDKDLKEFKIGDEALLYYIQPDYLDELVSCKVVMDMGVHPLHHGEKIRVYLVAYSGKLYFCTRCYDYETMFTGFMNITYDLVDGLGLINKAISNPDPLVSTTADMFSHFYKPKWVVMLGVERGEWERMAPFFSQFEKLVEEYNPLGVKGKFRVSVSFHYDDTVTPEFAKAHDASMWVD